MEDMWIFSTLYCAVVAFNVSTYVEPYFITIENLPKMSVAPE
jgi:hypothetical protein